MISLKIASILLGLTLLACDSLGVLNNISDHKKKDVAVEQADPTDPAGGEKTTRDVAENRISTEYSRSKPNYKPAAVYGLPPSGPSGNFASGGPLPPALSNFPLPPHQSFQFYGPPRKPFGGQPNLGQFPRPSKPSPWKLRPNHGHGIPTSLAAYGPPDRTAQPNFGTPIRNNYGPPKPSINGGNSIFINPPHPGPPPPGVPAPPTPPDIKYDGWQPIMGFTSVQEHPTAPGSTHPLPPTSSVHISTGISDSNRIIDGSRPTYIPSNSYGEPITSPDAHSLKQSVQTDNPADGLPPPVLPETEILHNVQTAAKSLPPHGKPVSSNQLNIFDSLPLQNIDSTNDLGLLLPHTSAISLNHNENDGFLSSNDLSLQQLPPAGLSPTSYSSFTLSPGFTDSYLAPPPSSFSSSGPYPPSRPKYGAPPVSFFQSHRPRQFPRTPFVRPLAGPLPPVHQSLVPPRSWVSIKFHEPNAPVALPSLTYGPSLVQSQPVPVPNCAQSTSAHHQGTSFSSSSFNRPAGIENFPSVSQLALDVSVPQLGNIGSTDSYGNALSFSQDQRSAASDQNAVINELANESSAVGESSPAYSPSGLSISNFEQLNKFQDGSGETALALAQTLATEGASADNFQIQGSQGTYTLQIQSADGTENSDGSIRHDQVLSNGLLQDILSAIEQPGQSGQVKLQGEPEIQSIDDVYRSDSSEFSNERQQINSNDLTGLDQQSSNDGVAVFFNSYKEANPRNQIRSTSKDERDAVVDLNERNVKIESNQKS